MTYFATLLQLVSIIIEWNDAIYKIAHSNFRYHFKLRHKSTLGPKRFFCKIFILNTGLLK